MTPSEETATIPIRLTFFLSADEEVQPFVEHAGFTYDFISTHHGFANGSLFATYQPRGYVGEEKPKRARGGKRGGKRRGRGGRRK